MEFCVLLFVLRYLNYDANQLCNQLIMLPTLATFPKAE